MTKGKGDGRWGAGSNDLGFFAKPTGWNNTTKECYKRGCRCAGCDLAGYDSKCQVKAAVLESVRLFGSPFDRVKVVMGE